ncbi:MAG: carboxyvinyl-carboxyphosphonate phosphorylmutase, partial [Dehalococcoidia bacterium]
YQDAGAVVLFVEGPRSRDELREIGRRLPAPLAVNLIEGGRTPICSLDELAEMGFYSVGFVLSGLYASARAMERTFSELRAAGSTDAMRGDLMAFDEFNELIGLAERYDHDEQYRA